VKIIKVVLFFLFFCMSLTAQTSYENPLGFTLNFDKTWKRLPKEILQSRMKDVKSALDYRKDIQFDACFQKIGNADMDYPYILFKNVYATTNNEEEISKAQKYFTNQEAFNKAVEAIVNGKFGVELSIGKNYYDAKNRILIFTYDVGISIKGNLVGLIAFYFGKKGSLITYCYSYKDEFKYDQAEFLEVIYSIQDKGMVNSMDDYVAKHDLAVRYYNDGKAQSEMGNREQAIVYYTKAINNYPLEDKFMISEAYYNRALNKRYLNDFKGAIKDYTGAIRFRPDYYKAYNNRGFAKLQIEDYLGAIEDFTNTIKYDNYNTEFTQMALGNRGVAKIALGQPGCADLRKAIELGNSKVVQIYRENCP